MNLFSTKIAHAAYDAPEGVKIFMGKLKVEIITPLEIALTAVAVAIFLYGVVEFLMNQANDEKKTDGKQHMLWGIIGLAIMVGADAIIAWFKLK